MEKDYELDTIPQNISKHLKEIKTSKVQIDEPNNEVPERGQWGKSVEFLLSCISMSVGLGNVWRFPNIAYNNGGGAFLIPYLILLMLIGRPLYYMEMVLGQFSGLGHIKVWKCVPAMKGIGYAQMVSVSYLLVFYNYLMALSLLYIFSSMKSELPWSKCDIDWADNGDCSDNFLNQNDSKTLPEQYWNNYVLHKSEGLGYITMIEWKLVLCLLLAWVIVYVSVMRGVQSLGKVTYFTAIFPYFVLIALLIVAVQQDGAGEGIKHLFVPQFDKLLKVEVWYKACEQSFFSLAVGYGNIVMFASYNDFKKNIARDALIIGILDTFTSILAGSVIFAVLGSLAYQQNKDFDQVVKLKDMGLAFIAYPEALAKIPVVPQLWSVLFFLMLFILGIGSSMSQLETVLSALKDRYPKLRKRTWLLALETCCIFFLCGLPLTTDAGQYIMQIIDNYGVGTAVFLYAILEIATIMWIYGWKNFFVDVSFMLGYPLNIFWKITWVLITPVALIVIFLYGNVMIALDKTGKEGIPWWGTLIGWLLAAFAIGQIPAWMIFIFYRTPGKGYKRFREAFKPHNDWGPRDPTNRMNWKKLKEREERSNSPDFNVKLNYVISHSTEL